MGRLNKREGVMKRIILSGCILALASANAAAAPVIIQARRAPPAQEVLTERVSFADLNISSDAGLRTLKGRIHAAAARVCGSNNPEPLQASIESLHCYRTAMSDSYGQIDRIFAARNVGTALVAATISVTAH
jgi:UrcA family protein